MLKVAVLIPGLMAGLVSNGQYAGYKLLTDAGHFRSEFAGASQKNISVKSDFTQEKELNMLSEKMTSSGKFWFKRENRLRMEYQQPFQYLLVINQANVYIKDGDRETRLSARSNKLFQQINNIMMDCVRGTALDNSDFSVRVFEGANAFLVELTPVSKNMKEYFKNIVLIIDKKNYSAVSIDMNELSGDHTTIRFLNKELNGTIPDNLFAVH